MRILLAVCVLGCGSNSPATTPVVKMTVTEPVIEAASVVDNDDEANADDGIEELGVEKLAVVRFTKNTVLRKAPNSDDELGTIRKDARAAVLREQAGEGACKRWLEIAPRGWTCDTTTEPTTLAPTKAKTFSFDEEDPTPPVTGTYGIVRGKNVQAYDTVADAESGNGRALVGNNTVRAAGSVRIDGKRYWRTSGGDLIDASSIVTIGSGSKFRGVQIEDSSAMPAWVRSHDKPRDPVVTRAKPSPRAKAAGKLAPRTVVSILQEENGFARVRVGDDEEQWISRRDLRATTLVEPPAGTAEHERWFDIDLDDQVLVAYEGKTPVYATMVSTGKYGHSTPVLITRIVTKLERTTMASDKQDVYSVADVPWTMFYDGNYALHSSYWHDGFGSVRSHGCINLAPHDARLLFRWSSPDVPPGWITVRGDEDHPGSLVRVHSSKMSEPNFRGYARKMREREQSDSVASR